MLGVYFALLGPDLAYALTRLGARVFYRLLTPVRLQSEAQCRAALRGLVRDEAAPRIAEQAFVHRVWNHADLLMAPRLLHPGTLARYGGRVPEPYLADLLDAQRRGQAAILVTAYYGPFDLLPIFLGFSGIRAAVVYRRHANLQFDELRTQARARGGCELVPVEAARERLPQVLEAGGTVAILADHHFERGGLKETFLGRPTNVPRTVGMLAWWYRADVVVAGVRRIGRRFRFEIDVVDVIKHAAWAESPEPIAEITRRYLRGLERLILKDPTQYLWAYPRWGMMEGTGNREREEKARRHEGTQARREE